ncbi:MAG: PAS domain S-box protein [Calditrichaeota bacterium]|nr:PAS domain S-box protein [Calditrichota bacterium]
MDVLEMERSFYKQQSDELSTKVVRLMDDQSRARREAGKSRLAASLLNEIYRLGFSNLSLDEISEKFLWLVLDKLNVDRAFLADFDPETSEFTPFQSLGFSRFLPGKFSVGKHPPHFHKANYQSKSTSFIKRVREVLNAPGFLWSFHEEAKIVLVVGNQAADEQVLVPFDDSDKEIIKGALNAFAEIREHKRTTSDLQYRLEFEKLISTISTFFINLPSEKINKGIQHGLAAVGEFVQADRAYVFLFAPDKKTINCTHEWCADEISPQIDHFTELPINTFSLWIEKLLRFETVSVQDAGESFLVSGHEASFLRDRNVKSLLFVPMASAKSLIGFLGIESVYVTKNWSDDTTLLLRLMGEVFVNALERQHADEALKNSDGRYKTLFETTVTAICVIEEDTTISLANSEFEKLSGYSKKQLEGQKSWLEFVTAADVEKMKAYHQKRRENPALVPRNYVFKFKNKNGEIRDIFLTISMIPGTKKSVASLLDITGIKQVEKALRLSEEKYRLLVDNANEAILIAQDGRLKFANPKTQEITGIPLDELLSRPFLEFVHPDDRQLLPDPDFKNLDGEYLSADHTFRIVRNNGEIRWLQMNSVLVTWDDRPASLNFISDITKRKEAENKLKKSLRETQDALDGTVKALSAMVERRDPYTAGHQLRVTKLSCAIARKLDLSEEKIAGIEVAGLLHDIGKLYIPADILNKPGVLSELEMSFIKTHPQVGYEILKSIKFPWPVADAILQHHERLDGSGYPKGLSGEKILIEARIFGVADVFETIASHRPYRPALGMERALDELIKNRGILYDPDIVDACIKLIKEEGFNFH